MGYRGRKPVVAMKSYKEDGAKGSYSQVLLIGQPGMGGTSE